MGPPPGLYSARYAISKDVRTFCSDTENQNSEPCTSCLMNKIKFRRGEKTDSVLKLLGWNRNSLLRSDAI